MKYRHHVRSVSCALLMVALAACASAEAQAETTRATGTDQRHEFVGLASWYAGKFQGRLTANGERFDTNRLTAAHKTLPFGTVVRVTHQRNGRSVEVRINDRGPFVEGRVIDLSRAAAEALEMTGEGIAPVSLSIVSHPEPPRHIVQVASFSSAENAERTRARLVRSDLDAQIEESDTRFRVVIGGVESDAIPALRARLAALGFPSVLVRLDRR